MDVTNFSVEIQSNNTFVANKLKKYIHLHFHLIFNFRPIRYLLGFSRKNPVEDINEKFQSGRGVK